MLFDTHVHLNAKKFNSDREEVIIVHNRDSNDVSTDIIVSEKAGENGGIVHSFFGDNG